jgi:hypothetical protein
MTAIVTMESRGRAGAGWACVSVDPPLDEGENYFRGDKCGGWFDARDLAWVEDHERALPHPACDRPQ